MNSCPNKLDKLTRKSLCIVLNHCSNPYNSFLSGRTPTELPFHSLEPSSCSGSYIPDRSLMLKAAPGLKFFVIFHLEYQLWKLSEIRLPFCNIVRIKTMFIFKVLLIGSFVVWKHLVSLICVNRGKQDYYWQSQTHTQYLKAFFRMGTLLPKFLPVPVF